MGQKYILIVASESAPEKEKEYNDWYTDKHIPDMFACKFMKKATRYKVAGEIPGAAKYLTIYEFNSKEDYEEFNKSPELDGAKKDFDETSGKVGFVMKWVGAYDLIKTWER
jgi:hypothetical protein